MHQYLICAIKVIKLIVCACVCVHVAPQSEAIVVYTGWERHALVGSDIRLSCSFFSWRWTSDDVTFSWSYRPDGAKDSISVRTHIHTCARPTVFMSYLCKCFVNQKDFQLICSLITWKDIRDKLYIILCIPKLHSSTFAVF